MSALTIAQVLNRAADLIEPEGRWTQGYYARRQDGKTTYTISPNAVSFCAIGAIGRVTGRGAGACADSPAIRALEAVAGRMPEWNDRPGRKQAQVVAKLREAAAKAREQGK